MLGQLGVGMLLSLAGYSAGGAWNSFYMLQQAYLIPAMSITLPSCATHFFHTFKWALLEEDSAGVWLRYGVCMDGCTSISGIDTSDPMRPPTYNIYKSGFETVNFMYNMADTFTLVFLLFGIVPVVSVVRLLLPQVTVVQNADRFIRGRFLITIVNVTYLKVAFLTMLNF